MNQSTFFQRNKELIFGVLVVAFAVAYLVSASFIETGTAVKIDSKMFPNLLGLLIGAIGLMQIRDGWKIRTAIARSNRDRNVPEVGISGMELRSAFPVIGIFALIVAFVLALPWLGFVIASSACLFLQILLLTPRQKRRPVATALLSIVVSLLIYLAFRKGLDLSLPEGLLSGII